MTLADLIISYLSDPFRIGLLIALLATTLRTASVTGRLIPLALGAVFVAILIPMTIGEPRVDRQTAIVAGFAANLVLLAILMAILMVWESLRRR